MNDLDIERVARQARSGWLASGDQPKAYTDIYAVMLLQGIDPGTATALQWLDAARSIINFRERLIARSINEIPDAQR